MQISSNMYAVLDMPYDNLERKSMIRMIIGGTFGNISNYTYYDKTYNLPDNIKNQYDFAMKSLILPVPFIWQEYPLFKLQVQGYINTYAINLKITRLEKLYEEV